MGIASNMNAGLYQHMHAFQVQKLSYNLGHHNVKFAAAGKQSNNNNCAARDQFVYTRAVATAGNVNTTLTYQLQSGLVPGQGAN